MKSTKVFVANFSSRVKKRDLQEMFEKFGKVVDIVMKERKEPYAFVEFEDVRDAEDAVEKMNGEEFFGKALRIEFCNGGKKKEFDINSSCFICHKKGHWARECPKVDGKTVVMGKCFLCGSSNHMMKDCTRYRDLSKSRSRSRSKRRSRSRSGSRDRRRRRSFRREESGSPAGRRSSSRNNEKRVSRSRSRGRGEASQSPGGRGRMSNY